MLNSTIYSLIIYYLFLYIVIYFGVKHGYLVSVKHGH